MIAALTWLLLYQLAGEVLARVLSWPVPGPVIGMALLFCTLVIRGHLGRPIPLSMQHTANTLLQHLSLLFVPAGTGVMVYLQLIADEWLPITTALITSTIAGMMVTALILRALMRRQRPSEGACDA
jgi:holin-like protein